MSLPLARMLRHALVAAAVLGLTAAAPARQDGVDLPLTPTATPQLYPALTFTLDGGVRGVADLTYRTLYGYRPLRLDLYLPPAANPPAGGWPVVVYVHGGGWSVGNKRQPDFHGHFLEVMAALAWRGYAVASIETRLREEARFPAPIQDAKSAIMWLRRNAGTYGLDGGRVAIWGGSSGGNIAGLVATSCGVPALAPVFTAFTRPGAPPPADPLAGESPCVQAAVAWYGVFDFRTLREQAIPGGDANFDEPTSAASRFLGCAIPVCPADRLAIADAVSLVDRRDPPMLLIHGTADRSIPYGQSVEFDRARKAAGVGSELILLPGSDHGFRAATPDRSAADMRRALTATFAFFDRTIGSRR